MTFTDSTDLHSHWKHCQNISINLQMADKYQQSPFWSITALRIKSTPTITAHWALRTPANEKPVCMCVLVCVCEISDWWVSLYCFGGGCYRCYATTKWGQACETATSVHHFHYSSDSSSGSCHFYLSSCSTAWPAGLLSMATILDRGGSITKTSVY